MAVDPRICVALQAPVVDGLLQELEERYEVRCLWETSMHGVAMADVEALVSNDRVDRSLIDLFPNLRLVANFGVGVDRVDLAYCRTKGILVSNTPDVLTDDVADLAILLMLAALRRLCAADRFVRDGLWNSGRYFPLARKASGLRVGIVGLGRIGMAIAKRAEGFSCGISYFSRAAKPTVPYIYYSNIVDLAANTEVLFISCSLSESTKHLVGPEVLDALGPKGALVNIARGAIVSEMELVKAIEEGRLGAAGLDVFENEPNVPQKLLNRDNVVLSPRAGSATVETRQAMGKLVVGNVDAYFSGKPLLTPVT